MNDRQRTAWGLDASIRTVGNQQGRDTTFDERTFSNFLPEQHKATSVGWGGRLSESLDQVDARGMDDALRQLNLAHQSIPANKAAGSQRDEQVHPQLKLTHRQAARQLELATFANDRRTLELLSKYEVNYPAPPQLECPPITSQPIEPQLEPHQLVAQRAAAQKELIAAKENAAAALKGGSITQKQADTRVYEAAHKLDGIKKKLDSVCDGEPLFQDEWGDLAVNTIWANQRQNRREQNMEIHWEEGPGRHAGHHMLERQEEVKKSMLERIALTHNPSVTLEPPENQEQPEQPSRHRRRRIVQSETAALERELWGGPVEIEWWDYSRQCVNDQQVAQLCYKASAHQGAQVLGLKLQFNCIGPRGGVRLAQLFRECRFIAALHLDSNAIGDQGACHIAAAIITHPGVLTSLSLAANQIGNSGAEALGRLVAQSSRLEALELKHNVIHDNGLEQLASGLRQNRSLKRLSLEGNLFSSNGAKLVLDATVIRSPSSNQLTTRLEVLTGLDSAQKYETPWLIQ